MSEQSWVLKGIDPETRQKAEEEARKEATNRMIAHAHEIGADAIIGMRFDSTEFGQGSTEVLAYGTAVKLRN